MEKRKIRKPLSLGRVLCWALLIFWAIMVLFPFYWMILSSVKSYSAYNSEYIPSFFTLHPTLENYFYAFSTVPLGGYFVNTLHLGVASTRAAS